MKGHHEGQPANITLNIILPWEVLVLNLYLTWRNVNNYLINANCSNEPTQYGH